MRFGVNPISRKSDSIFRESYGLVIDAKPDYFVINPYNRRDGGGFAQNWVYSHKKNADNT